MLGEIVAYSNNKRKDFTVRTTRIYQPRPLIVGETIPLTPDAAQHVGTVLRMHEGETLTLFCGDNREFAATIDAVQKRKVTVQIQSEKLVNRESSCDIHLAQALSKGERMEWVIQKAVELGVKSITPLITKHCVVRLDEGRLEKKHHQWQSIAIAACEQSGRNTIPVIEKTMTIEDYLVSCTTTLKLLLHPQSTTTWRDLDKQVDSIALIIGPEGGLNQQEVDLAQRHQFQILTIGPRVLRTETAAITALSILQAMAGDL